MSEPRMKSAVELALERLKKKDAEAGVEERPLTEDQKAAIAEIRRVYEARIAQEEVMSRSELVRTFEPEKRAEIDRKFRHERDRLAEERDRKIDEARERR